MTLPPIRHYEFTRSRRWMQVVRAILVLLVGVGVVYARQFVNADNNALVNRILLYVGGFIAFSGVLALLALLIAVIFDKKRVIEVDENGLIFRHAGKPDQSVKWADVTTYEVDAGGVLDLNLFTPSTTNTSSSQSSDDAFGCLFGAIFGIYFLLLEAFIGGSSWKVKLKLKSRRSVTVSGYDRQMDEFIGEILPRYLPDKRKQPGQSSKPDNKTTSDDESITE